MTAMGDSDWAGERQGRGAGRLMQVHTGRAADLSLRWFVADGGGRCDFGLNFLENVKHLARFASVALFMARQIRYFSGSFRDVDRCF